MEIKLTWHLMIVMIFTIILVVNIFRDQESGLDLSFFFYGIILIIMWIIYGGIFIW